MRHGVWRRGHGRVGHMTILDKGTANCELEADLRVGRVFIAQFLDMI